MARNPYDESTLQYDSATEQYDGHDAASTQNADGTITPGSGVVVKTAADHLVGAATPAGVVSKTITDAESGAVTPSGAMDESLTKTAAGSVTPAGSEVKTPTKVLASSGTTATLRPNADGPSSSPTYSSGSTAYTLVDETVLDDNDYVAALALDAYVTVGFDDPPAGFVPSSVTLYAYINNNAAASTAQLAVIRPSDNSVWDVYAIVQQNLLDPPLLVSWTMSTPPWGGQWTRQDVVDLIAGIHANTVSGPFKIRLYQIWAVVAGQPGPSGAVSKNPSVHETGAVTPDGSVSKTSTEHIAGSVTPSAVVVKTLAEESVGSITPDGAVNDTISRVISGSAATDGSLGRLATTIHQGDVAPDGSVSRAASTTLEGMLEPSGELATEVVHPNERTFDGSVSPTGRLARVVSITLGGGVEPSGEETSPSPRTGGLAGYVYNKIFVLQPDHLRLMFDGFIKPAGRLFTTVVKGTPKRVRFYEKNRAFLLGEIDEDLAELLT